MEMLTLWLTWLENTWVGTGIRESLYVYPALHFVHILSNSLMFGMIVFLDLRLLGFGLRRQSVSDVAEQLLPWTWAGWTLMFLSGALIFSSDAVRYSESTPFLIKMGLMLLAACNAAVFHNTAYRKVAQWGQQGSPPLPARMAGGVSILTWLAVISTGRWIGYAGY